MNGFKFFPNAALVSHLIHEQDKFVDIPVDLKVDNWSYCVLYSAPLQTHTYTALCTPV